MGREAEGIIGDETYLTACHEVGHGVAALLRDGTFSGISIATSKWRDGGIWTRVRDRDVSFVAFAGPWAEARARWPDLPLDQRDDFGRAFHDLLTEAFLHSGKDLMDYAGNVDAALTHMLGNAWPDETPEVPSPDPSWNTELETHWPIIRSVADRLMSGERITPEKVQGLLTQRSS
ncbi:hypothetical protein [Mycolicibacterium sp. XJ1904]